MTAVAERREITAPGIHLDMPAVVYHGDPIPGGSLSSTGARRLLPPSCPALFQHERDNGQKPKRVFDFGSAAHDHLLGGGPEVVVVDAPDWRTDRAKSQRDEARERGAVPLLRAEWVQVEAMAVKLREHPVAGKLLSPEYGTPEASLFWTDDATEVWRRARLDVLPHPRRRGRLILPDYKSAVSAEPSKFAKAAADLGYHQQAAWYLDAARALGVADDDARFVFVVQEKTAPYLVSVIELDVIAMRIGAGLNRRAIDTYAECTRTGVWPGYVTDVATVPLPAYYERAHEEDVA